MFSLEYFLEEYFHSVGYRQISQFANLLRCTMLVRSRMSLLYWMNFLQYYTYNKLRILFNHMNISNCDEFNHMFIAFWFKVV
jgi:hypothetical protein